MGVPHTIKQLRITHSLEEIDNQNHLELSRLVDLVELCRYRLRDPEQMLSTAFPISTCSSQSSFRSAKPSRAGDS